MIVNDGERNGPLPTTRSDDDDDDDGHKYEGNLSIKYSNLNNFPPIGHGVFSRQSNGQANRQTDRQTDISSSSS